MDIPLHPKVETEIARGREFLDRIRSARRTIAGLRVTVPCPDGDNEIVFGGDGMVVDATFAEDVFGRYPADKLSELLLAMSAEGFAQVSSKVTAEVAGVLEHRTPPPMPDSNPLTYLCGRRASRFTVPDRLIAHLPCSHRPSGGDIACSVHVGVTRPRGAGFALKTAWLLRCSGRDMPACGAPLRRVRGRDLLDPASSFVLQTRSEQTPSASADATVDFFGVNHCLCRWEGISHCHLRHPRILRLSPVMSSRLVERAAARLRGPRQVGVQVARSRTSSTLRAVRPRTASSCPSSTVLAARSTSLVLSLLFSARSRVISSRASRMSVCSPAVSALAGMSGRGDAGVWRRASSTAARSSVSPYRNWRDSPARRATSSNVTRDPLSASFSMASATFRRCVRRPRRELVSASRCAARRCHFLTWCRLQL